MPWKSDFVRKIDFVISDIFSEEIYTHLLNLFYNYGKQ